MGAYLTRLVKAFILSAVAVYSFVNGPSLYANIRFFFQGTESPQTQARASESAPLIKPVALPVAFTYQQPSSSNAQEQLSLPTPLPNQATLSIPKLNVNVPIVFGVPSEAERIYENLTSGVVHYSVSPKPGQGGAAIILGHSSLYPWQKSAYGSPFALLGKLRPGDKISVSYSDGQTFTYNMKQSIVFNPLESDGDARLAELERSTKPLLILVTCWPINSSTNRIALQAELE